MPDGFAGIYLRISRDREGGGLGVDRQLHDCMPLVLAAGYPRDRVRIYTDNDMTASDRRKPRKDYERLLRDVAAQELSLLAAWHNDRLHRLPGELEEFIETVEKAGLTDIRMHKAGHFDLSTASGRLVARMLGAAARYQVEHMIEQVKAKHEQLARSGKSAGGGRPFGFEPDRRTLRPPYAMCRILDRVELLIDEPQVIRDAAKAALEGVSLRAICAALDLEQIPTTQGTIAVVREVSPGMREVVSPAWHAKVMRQMLASARISGRRGVGVVNGRRIGVDRIVSDTAEWPAIISAEESDRLRVMFGGRKGGSPPRRQLLSGICRCSFCGSPLRGRTLRGSKPQLVCPHPPYGCNRIRMASERAEEAIRAMVLDAIDRGALDEVRRREVGDADQVVVEELAQVRAKLTELATDWAEDRISRDEWGAAKAALDVRVRRLQRRVESSQRLRVLDELPGPLPEGWLRAQLPQQRAFLSLLVECVIVHPGRGNVFNPNRLEVRWRV